MVEPTETRVKSEESKEKKFAPKFNKTIEEMKNDVLRKKETFPKTVTAAGHILSNGKITMEGITTTIK